MVGEGEKSRKSLGTKRETSSSGPVFSAVRSVKGFLARPYWRSRSV